MSNRPLSVTILSWVLIASGVIGLAHHLDGLHTQLPVRYDAIWMTLVRLVAVVCGVGILRGADWARWLTCGWISFHAVLSAFHSTSELLMHTLFLAAFSFVLFRPEARAYFRRRRTTAA
jgi:hypothetical protein